MEPMVSLRGKGLPRRSLTPACLGALFGVAQWCYGRVNHSQHAEAGAVRLSVAPGGHIDLLERSLDSGGPSIPRGPRAAGIALVGCLASPGVTVTQRGC